MWKSYQMKEKYKKPIQFIQDTYNGEIDDDDNTLAHFGLWNVGDNHELDIRRIFLIENKSKVNLFWNKKLVTQLCTTNNPTKVKANGECIRTTHKYNVKGMVRYSLMRNPSPISWCWRTKIASSKSHMIVIMK